MESTFCDWLVLVDCSQSPIFPWDHKCRSLSLMGRHLSLLMRTKCPWLGVVGATARAFCSLPNFVRKRPRWRPVKLADQQLRSCTKIGDCEQSYFLFKDPPRLYLRKGHDNFFWPKFIYNNLKFYHIFSHNLLDYQIQKEFWVLINKLKVVWNDRVHKKQVINAHCWLYIKRQSVIKTFFGQLIH